MHIYLFSINNGLLRRNRGILRNQPRHQRTGAKCLQDVYNTAGNRSHIESDFPYTDTHYTTTTQIGTV